MRKSRFSEEQIIGILKEHQAGLPVAEICRRHGISCLLSLLVLRFGMVQAASRGGEGWTEGSEAGHSEESE